MPEQTPAEPIATAGDLESADDIELEQPVEKPKRSARGLALVGVRVVAGTVGLGVAVVSIAAAALIPLPVIQASAPGVVVTPVPSAQQLVCPGTFLRLGDEQGQDATSATAIGRSVTRFGSTAGTVDELSLDAGGTSPGSPTRLALPAGGDETALLAASQSQQLESSDFVGLASAACAGASTESWLVGGSAAVGRTTLLTLSNPSDVVATVSVDIYGESGVVTAPGASGIVVQPLSQRVLSLSGFAPGLETPVVHVVSRGGQIVSNLNQVTVRGLDAGGVDLVGAAAPPSTTQVIPGLVTANSIALRGALGATGFADLETVVRLLAPGDEQTTVTVTIAPDDGLPVDEAPGEEGTTRGAILSFDLIGGEVTDLPIDNLKDGSYTVTVTADVPVVAGVRASTVIGDAPAAPVEGEQGAVVRPQSSDFAWLASASPLSTETLVSIADGPGATIHFANPGSSEATVNLSLLNGPTTTLQVPAGGAASAPVTSGRLYTIDGFESLRASVSYLGLDDTAQLSSYTVQPGAASATPLTVYPR